MLDGLLRRLFPIIVAGCLAVAAYFQAAGLNALLGATLLEASIEAVPAARGASILEERAVHTTSATAILTRNPFDSVTGPLDAVQRASAVAHDEPPDRPCDTGQVMLIVLSKDDAWSFAAIASAGQCVLRRRGDEVDGRVVERLAWDRVWLARDGVRCHLRLGVKDPSVKPAPVKWSTQGPTGRKNRGAKDSRGLLSSRP